MNHITLEIQPTKKDFTDKFNKLKLFGYDVKNFNSHRAMGTGTKGFVDHLITGHGHLVFVEVKIGKDKQSKEQKKFESAIKSVMEENPKVKYWCITKITEALGIVDYLVEHQN